MQTYRTAQQMIGSIFEKYSMMYFSNAIEEFRQEELSKDKFLEILDGYSRENAQMRDEINEFFAEKLKRTKTLTRQEVCEVNSEMLPGELDDILRDQSKRTTKKSEAEAKKAAKKAEAEAKKVAKKAETEAKKAAKKAETEARKEEKKALKKAEADAKKEERNANKPRAKKVKEPVLESFARDQEILKRTRERAEKFVEDVVTTALEHIDLFGEETPREQEDLNVVSDRVVDVQEEEEIVHEEIVVQEIVVREEIVHEEIVQEEIVQEEIVQQEIPVKKPKKERSKPNSKEAKEAKPKEAKTKEAKEAKTNEVEEPRYKIKGHVLEDTKTRILYFLRETEVIKKQIASKETRVFTKNRLVGSWDNETILFFNLEETHAKRMQITPQMCASIDTPIQCYINGDCTLYLDQEGSILGTYFPETDTVIESLESDESDGENDGENDGELSEDDYEN